MENTAVETNKQITKTFVICFIFFCITIYFFASNIYQDREHSAFQTHLIGSYSFQREEFEKKYSKINLNKNFDIPNVKGCFLDVEIDNTQYAYIDETKKEILYSFYFKCKNNKRLNFNEYFISRNPSEHFNGYVYFSYSSSFDSTFARNKTIDSYKKEDLEKLLGSPELKPTIERVSKNLNNIESLLELQEENRDSWK